MKRMISQDALLAFPDFKKELHLYIDASDEQIGAVLSQEGKPLGFFSKKINQAQSRYTVTQKELLAIVEALNHFRTMVFGHKVKVFTDHKNLTHEGTHFTSDRILRQ